MSTVQTLIDTAKEHHSKMRDNKAMTEILEIVQLLVEEAEGLRAEITRLEKKIPKASVKMRAARVAKKKEA